MTQTLAKAELLGLTAQIVQAHVGRSQVALAELPGLIQQIYATLLSTDGPVVVQAPPQRESAVSVKKSVAPDHLVCLECGKWQKTLKRHLMSSHELTPDGYRARWKLPPDYPMVAPNYAAARSVMAKAIGFGTKNGRRRKSS